MNPQSKQPCKDFESRILEAMKEKGLIEHIAKLYGAVIVRPVRVTFYPGGEIPKRAEFHCVNTSSEFKVVVKFDKEGYVEEDYRTAWK